jgi:hypothetical protein
MTDLHAAAQFIASHARLIDRRRFAFLAGDGSPEAVVRALAAYRNDDDGFGQLEPDVRAPSSQPLCALSALEILHEVQATDLSLATAALDWLQTVSNDDGGVPFVLPTAEGWPHAPWMQPQDPPGSSLLATAGIAAAAHRLGLDHPWLAPATDYCWARTRDALTGDAYAFRFVIDFLDAVPERERAAGELGAMAGRVPADGLLRVDGGTEGEALRPLDIAPRPDHMARGLFDDAVIERELERLAAEQQEDGGWTFTWLAWNPAVTWEWRGAVTVAALRTLRAYDRLDVPAAARSDT